MDRLLRDVADVHYGKSPRDVLDEDGAVPVMGTGGLYGHASQSLFTGPAVVVPRKGSLGNPQYVEGAFWPVDTTYAVLPKRGVDARWLYYSLDLFDLTKLNEATGVPSISRDWLYKVPVSSAESGQQQRIAQILSTVDQAITQTEALIAKTQQIKAGLMHDLFTRGVTPDGQLRPAREEAPKLYKQSPLGWIPKEWELGGIEAYLQPDGIKPGPFGSALTKADYSETGYRVYGQEQVLAGTLAAGSYYVPESKWRELGGFAVQEGDLLMTLVGVGTVGKILVVRTPFEPGIINPRLMRLRPDRSACCIPFLAQLIPSPLVRRQFNLLATGGTMPVVNGTIVRKVRVPVLQFAEQEKIATRLAACDARFTSESAVLEKLRLVKTGLMHDLLSGRVRVPVDQDCEVAASA